MINLDNTFKITITNKDGNVEDTILTGPITFTITSSSNTENKFCFLRMREFSQEYDMEKVNLAKQGANIIKKLNRETMDKITVAYLTTSEDYRVIFDKKLNDIEELSFEYSNDIGDQVFAQEYNSSVDFVIKYSINN